MLKIVLPDGETEAIKVEVRDHICRGPLCLECGRGLRPKVVSRPMTLRELAERDRLNEPIVPFRWDAGADPE